MPVSLTPDLPVSLLVAVLRVVDILRSAILVHVGRNEEMRRGDEAARLLAREGAIQFIHFLPPVQPQWLSDRRDLVFVRLDPLEGRLRTVAGRNCARVAVAGYAGGLQRGRHEIESQVVDGQTVGPLLAVPLQE